MVVSASAKPGVRSTPPLGSIYVWVPTPAGQGRRSGSRHELLDQAAVVVAPGTGYGEQGEGYIRISLSVPDDRSGVEAIANASGSGRAEHPAGAHDQRLRVPALRPRGGPRSPNGPSSRGDRPRR